jgi:3-oxoacyl-[acyl-carrier protein] reductase
MDLHLAGRSFIVAGSSRGIGRAIAAALLDEGARVCLTGRDASSLAETAGALGPSERVTSYCGDLVQPQAISALFDMVAKEWNSLDGLVANVGSGSGKLGWDLPESEWERIFALNFQASTRLAQAAIPPMMANGGSIVFVSSIAGVEALPAPLPYSAAKAALLSYSKNLSRQVATHGIRVNCVAPGNVIFPGGSWARRVAEQGETVLKSIRAEVPMERFGTPEEIANLVTYLCSDRASFVTGSCFVADGGQTRSL